MGRLRREAAARVRLTERQIEAGRRAEQLLLDMAASGARPTGAKPELMTMPPRGYAFLPRVDLQRENRVVLLDGGRGAGKTTLLYKLLRRWSERVQRGGGRARVDEDASSDLPELAREQELLIPLAVIDLMTLPPQNNLLMQLAIRLRRVMDAIAHDDDRAPDRRWRAGSGGSPDESLMHRWERLARTIAGFEGNLHARRSRTDEETYVLELEDAARAGSELDIAVIEFVDALEQRLETVHELRGYRLLFVLPIDDADLNYDERAAPARIRELFALLRNIYHPRLAYLLTGSTTRFVSDLRERHNSSGRVEGAAGVDEVTRYPIEPYDRPRYPVELYDRIIPPSHRCEIRAIKPDARLHWSDPLEADAPTSSVPPLLELFQSATTRVPGLRAQVTEVYPPLLSLADIYIGAANGRLQHLLPDRLRGLVDLQLELNQLSKAELDEMYPEYVVYRIFRFWLGRGSLNARREDVEDFVQLMDNGLYIVGAASPTWRIEFRELAAREDTSVRLSFRVPFRRTVELANKVPLERELVAALTLATDVAMYAGGPNRFIGPQPTPHGFEGVFAMASCRLADGKPLEIGWPLLSWGAFHPFDLFEATWTKLVHMLAGGNQDSGSFARAYLMVVASVASRRLFPAIDSTMEIPKVDGVASDVREPDARWEYVAHNLLQALEESRVIDRERFNNLEQFLRYRAPLLAAPESGLPADVANAWWRAVRTTWPAKLGIALDTLLIGFSHERRERIRFALGRRGTGTTASDQMVDAVLAELRSRFPGYQWYDEVPEQPSAITVRVRTEFELSEVRLLLEAAVIPHPEGSFTRGKPERLAGYLQTSARRHMSLSPPGHIASGAGAEMIVAALAGHDGQFLPLSDGQIDSQLMQHGFAFVLSTPDLHAKLGEQVGSPRALLSSLTAPLFQKSELRHLIAADYFADTGRLACPTLPLPNCWPGLMLKWTNHEQISVWPFVRWPGIFDLELVHDGWNAIIRTLHDVSDLLRPAGPDLLDEVARRFVDLQLQVAEHRFYEPPSSAPSWDEVLSNMVAIGNSYQGARWAAFHTWASRLALFASPESGLPYASANLLIERLQPGPELEVARRDRLSADAQRIVQDLSAVGAFDGHPWGRIEDSLSARTRGDREAL